MVKNLLIYFKILNINDENHVYFNHFFQKKIIFQIFKNKKYVNIIFLSLFKYNHIIKKLYFKFVNIKII